MFTVLERLAGYAPDGVIPDSEIPVIQRAILDLQRKGWTNDEIVSKLRWLEHVDPIVPEDVALRKMKMVDEKVALRLKELNDARAER